MRRMISSRFQANPMSRSWKPRRSLAILSRADCHAVGFLTDASVCIVCKACEVACKEGNQVPDDGFRWSGNSYDNTAHLGASTWRQVMFLEQDRQKGNQVTGPMGLPADAQSEDPFRWVFLSDVCKHCDEAGCLESC